MLSIVNGLNCDNTERKLRDRGEEDLFVVLTHFLYVSKWSQFNIIFITSFIMSGSKFDSVTLDALSAPSFPYFLLFDHSQDREGGNAINALFNEGILFVTFHGYMMAALCGNFCRLWPNF